MGLPEMLQHFSPMAPTRPVGRGGINGDSWQRRLFNGDSWKSWMFNEDSWQRRLFNGAGSIGTTYLVKDPNSLLSVQTIFEHTW